MISGALRAPWGAPVPLKIVEELSRFRRRFTLLVSILIFLAPWKPFATKKNPNPLKKCPLGAFLIVWGLLFDVSRPPFFCFSGQF